MAKGKEVMVPASDAQLAALRNEFPADAGFNRVLLPRFGLISQDVTEGKGKSMKVITEAGTLFTEKQTEEIDEETGNKKWEREELGTEAEGIILFQRKQLKFYDESTEMYTSSPIYDTDDEIIPLFLDKKEIKRGTPAELKLGYPGVSLKGKPMSKLQDNRILYVLINGEVHQLNLRGTSMYSFFKYARGTLVPSVLTAFSSEAQEKGSTAWNMMTFTPVRQLTGTEVAEVLAKVAEIKQGIAAEKAYYSQQTSTKADGESTEDAAARIEANNKF